MKKLFLLLILLFSFSPLFAQTTPTPAISPALTPGHVSIPQTITGHVPKEIQTAPLVGDVPLDQKLYLSIGFPIQNKEAMDKEMASIYDPKSSNFGKFLSPEEYGDRFGLPLAEYQKATFFFRFFGFKIKGLYKSRLLITVEATVADIQKILHIHLLNYKRPDGTLFHAPDREPSIDLNIPLLHISNLDNFDRPRPDIIEHRLKNTLKVSVTPNP